MLQNLGEKRGKETEDKGNARELEREGGRSGERQRQSDRDRDKDRDRDRQAETDRDRETALASSQIKRSATCIG